MADLPVYEGWRRVPSGLFSKTQLADLDFPRVPGGPVRAYADVANWRGKKEFVELYALPESLPSLATAAQLEAARARARPTAGTIRVCEGCGAHPDRPVTAVDVRPSDGPTVPATVARLCPACARIARLQDALRKAADLRALHARWAAEVLDPQRSPSVVVRVDEVLRPPAPSGRQNPAPVALVVDAVDATGRRLIDATIRLAGTRVKAVPAGALAPNAIEEQVRAALSGVVVTWMPAELWHLRRVYRMTTSPGSYAQPNPHDLKLRATYWRGEIDPQAHGLTYRTAIDPGTADRTLLLLRRMAATDLSAEQGPQR
ncbi:hypothetical protein [Micromonospora sp. NPDC050200]|uniref:hypothetical protein n=1 Tax=Micromonospora sp. NPDC050200 TaxID=3155664 RepID=UPI0033E28018